MLKMDLNQKIDNLQARMARIERKFQLLEAGFNKKILWVMNNVVLKSQLLNSSTGFQQQQQPLIKPRTRPRILSHPSVSRRHRVTRFIIPQVQYGNDNDDNNEDQDGQQNYNDEPMDQEENNWAQQQEDVNENDDDDEQDAGNNNNDNDNDNEEYYEDDEHNAQSRSEDPLAIDEEEYETTKDDGQDQDEEQQNTSNPWRFNLTAEENNEEDQTEEDNFNLEGQNKMIRRRNFLDIKPFPLNIENSRVIVRRPTASSNNAIKMNRRRLLINSFRAIQPRTTNSQVIVPKNRYLMSNAAEARLKNARLSDTTLESRTSYVRSVNPQNRDGSLPPLTPAPDRKEKVYYCDRCPLTFTLSTRHAHNELHKKMDMKKQQQGSSSPSQNSRSDLGPIGSSLRTALNKTRTKQRTRPRKLCPICTKSYSRNQYLRNHIGEHANDYPYICKECFSVFNNSTAFEQHLAKNEKCYNSPHQTIT